MTPNCAWMKDAINPVMSLIVVIGGGLLIWKEPALKTEVIAIIMVVVGYHFGSSKGSQDKDKIIEQKLNREG